MKLYDIEVKVNETDFEVKVTNHNVINYIEKEKVSYYTAYGTTTIYYPKLDEVNVGLLIQKFPSISISTVDEVKVEEYKKLLTEILKNELKERLQLSQKQLELIA